MEDLVINIFDESNNSHHIKPNNLILPKIWGEAYTFQKYKNGIEDLASHLDIMHFVEFIIKSVSCIQEDAKGNGDKMQIVINRFFNPEKCRKKIFIQSTTTIYHFYQCSTKEDWYEDMVDFIEYNELTFGMPSTGYRQYLDAVQYLIERQDPDPKLAKLSEFIRVEFSKHKKKSDKNRLPALFEMFDEWWKSIPFDLEYLKPIEKDKNELKALFFATGPKNDAQINRYSHVVKISAYSPTELYNALCKLTTAIIQELNLLTYNDKNLISDLDKIELQFDFANRRKELENYSFSDTNMPPDYVRIWRKWLKEEEVFFFKIKSRLSSKSSENQKGQKGMFLTFMMKNPDHLKELKAELGMYVDDADKLSILLDGKTIDGKVLILGTCPNSKFCEIFKRLSYNGLIANHSSEIIVWLMTYFRSKDGDLNLRSLQDQFHVSGKPVSRPIRDFSWMQFKDKIQLEKEAKRH